MAQPAMERPIARLGKSTGVGPVADDHISAPTQYTAGTTYLLKLVLLTMNHSSVPSAKPIHTMDILATSPSTLIPIPPFRPSAACGRL